jgi:hypothetical protein
MDYPLLPSFCAYLDILGFSLAIEEAYAQKREQQLLAEISEALNKSTVELKEFRGRSPAMTVKFFTDNIVIGLQQTCWDEMELLNLCWFVANYQMEMACKGFFIRGGISVGTLFSNDSIVFGNALLKAYKLENTKACYPRIIIDPILKESVEKQLATKIDWFRNTVNFQLMRDVDDCLFVNYLHKTFETHRRRDFQPGFAYYPNEDKIMIHRRQVERRLKEVRSKPEIWSKYFWVANYHNGFCDRLGKPHCKIDESFLSPKGSEAEFIKTV